jgi:hypothetical protein
MCVSDLLSAASTPDFGNATLYTWTAGLERKLGNLTADASYVGTAGVKAAAHQLSQRLCWRYPAFAPYDTQFDSAGNVTGGFGVESVITATAHSTYHALQTSLSGSVGHGGPGVQASYTWSKSLDDTSEVRFSAGYPALRRIPMTLTPKKVRRRST